MEWDVMECNGKLCETWMNLLTVNDCNEKLYTIYLHMNTYRKIEREREREGEKTHIWPETG